MFGYKELVLVPVGLIIISFILELLRTKFPVISSTIVLGVFWLGIGVLALAVLLTVIKWIKEFSKEMRGR